MMKRLAMIAALAAGVLIFGQTPLTAKRLPEDVQKKLREAAPEDQDMPTLTAELTVVRRLMRAGKFQDAASYLESLLSKYPDDWQIKNTLQECYFQGKMFDKLLLFLQRRLEQDGQNFQVLRDMGRTWLQKGEPDSTMVYFYRAVSTSDNDPSVVSFLAGLFSQLGYYEQTAAFVDSLRKVTGTAHLAPLQMGDALSALKKYSAAADEYLIAMNTDTTVESDAVGKLRELVQYPESSAEVMKTLKKQLQADSTDKKLTRLYGEFLLDQEKFDDAFAYFLDLDDSAAQKGLELLYYMNSCADRKNYKPVIRAGERFRKRFSRSPVLLTAELLLAEAYTKTGQYQKALDTYESVAGMSANERDLAEINLQMGLIYKEHLKDFDRAWRHLALVKNIYPSGPAAQVATMQQGEILIYERKFDSALAVFTKLDSTKMISNEMSEAIAYAIAEVNLFKGNHQATANLLKLIIARFPRGFFVNDAIGLSLVLDEMLQSAPDKIGLLASAEYFDYIKDDDSLEYYLKEITEDSIEALTPISYLRLARLYFSQERFEETLSAVQRLTESYPESYFVPFGLKIKADVLIKSPGKKKEALEIYQELLEKYPTYPFAAEIRDILRKELPLS
jgi:tetratricopeptide (TPR) repeat protein